MHHNKWTWIRQTGSSFSTTYPLQSKRERESEGETEEKVGGNCNRHYFFTWGGAGDHKFLFAATNVPRQFPLALLVRTGLLKVMYL